MQKCTAGSITICPADKAIFDSRLITCESRLYFHAPDSEGRCRRSLTLSYEAPTLVKHGDAWVYHIPSPRQVSIRFPRGDKWVTEVRTLSDAGLIRNASACSISSGEVRGPPELHGVMNAHVDGPSLYVPGELPVFLSHEVLRVEATITDEVNTLDQLTNRLEAAQKSFDVDMMLHLQKATARQETQG